MLYHKWVSPSLFNLIRVVCTSETGSIAVISVCKICGRRWLRCLTIDFLLVMMTPPICRGLFTKAVMNCFAGFDIGPRVSFPKYVMDRIAIRSSAVGKLKKVFRIDAFLTWSSIT